MENKHKCSDGIRNWSRACLIIGILLFPVAFVVWIEEGSWVAVISAAAVALVCRPLLKGLSLLVRNAETQLEKENDME